MMGRKRNQGKARKAAKEAKSTEAMEVRENNDNQAAASEQPLSATQMRQSQSGEKKCTHGFDLYNDLSTDMAQFINAFRKSVVEADESGDRSFLQCLLAAHNVTLAEFADVWCDSAKLAIAISCLLCLGTQAILDNKCDHARLRAVFARYFEQHIAVELKRSQALVNWPKIIETHHADLHTLVKFYRHRIPCSCLDEKYQEVKHIAKKGCCYNAKCSTQVNRVERSKTKYCSRCRNAVYCSRECHVEVWTEHKPDCDNDATIIANFEAKMAEK